MQRAAKGSQTSARLPGKALAFHFGNGTPVIRLKYTGISYGTCCEEMQKQQLLC